MTDLMASLFVDVHPSKAELTLFLEGNCVLIAFTVSVYFLQQMLLSMLVDGSTNSLCNGLYDCPSSKFDIPFPGI